MKILIILSLLFTLGCDDQIIEPETEYKTVSSLCPVTSPEAEPSLIKFDGLERVTKVTRTSAEISWTHIDGLHAYNIISVTTVDRKIINTVLAPKNKLKLKGLIPNTNYKILVRALDNRGHIDTNTNVVEFTTLPWPSFNNSRSLAFSGAQNITFGASKDILTSDNSTVSLWIKRDREFKDDQRIITFHRGGSASSALSLGVNRKLLEVNFTDNEGNFQTKTKTFDFSDDIWHQVTTVIQPNRFSIFIDGKKFLSINKSLASFGTHPFHLASYTGIQKSFIGKMDELAFFDIALRSNQVKELYNNGSAYDLNALTFSNTLTHWYQFGDQIADNSSNIEDNIGSTSGSPLNLKNSDFQVEAP